ncbi:N-acetylglucosamine-6-phosphate deacetylase [Bacillaceae bacterium SIJ1]|uniref:N-acetylglucosamine-6-phosphate deacetylase n=1 Tax=Litoribacterium kuwaitense TaxID=1398745 RepID=UPI0013EAEC2F|nr:N-acetylglucosamine-6-phosphate deacetylase [Litoribacterium kuwaitense]NGP43955.1 N-acetylglucosamine-6-phosphate deacetylase [Litoribacterium kuwaitense]
MKTILRGVTVYTERGVIEDGEIAFERGSIVGIGEAGRLSTEGASVISYDKPVHVIPGMIDVHIHGTHGADTMDATTEALDTMSRGLPEEGTTSFLATTITQEQEAIEAALANAKNYIETEQKPGHAEVLGVHLEGPFLNEKRCGAQPKEHMVTPSVDVFKNWQALAGGHIKLVTLAPELDQDHALTAYLKANGVIASIGHSDADYTEVMEAVNHGVTHATHLYNGMKGLHHREPGVVGAVYMNDRITAELIADGIHSRPEMLDLALRMKGPDKLVLITDAMRAKCLKRGNYDLGGQSVTVTDDRAVLENGALAGSILRMVDGLKNMVEYSGKSLRDLLPMTAYNQAQELGVLARKGSLAVGKDADIVVMDDSFSVIETYCRGTLSFAKKEGEDE